MYWFIDGMKRYFQFSGRAGREAFWMFYLVLFIINAVFEVFERIPALNGVGVWLGGLFTLVALIPFLAVSARRLHDIGRSGWWQLIGLIPILGWLVLLYFFIQVGDTGTNSYGPSPLNQSREENNSSQNGSPEPYVAKPRHNPAYK